MGTGQSSRASRSASACSGLPRSVRSPPITSTSASLAAPSARARRRLVSPTRVWRSAVAAIFMAVLSPLLVQRSHLPGRRALVGQAPLLHVHGEAGFVEHRPAEAEILRVCFLLVALPEDLQDPAGQVMGVARVHIAVEVEVGEKKLPMVAYLIEDTVPVEVPAHGEYDVEHVVHVAAVLRNHEYLREDHLLGRDDECLSAEDGNLLRVREPGLFYGAGAVVGSVNDVHEELPPPRLGDPEEVLDLRLEACFLQRLEDPRHDLFGYEHVEVLGVAPDARVGVQRQGAAEHVTDAGAVQGVEGFAVDLTLFASEVWFPDHMRSVSYPKDREHMYPRIFAARNVRIFWATCRALPRALRMGSRPARPGRSGQALRGPIRSWGT